VLFIFLALLAFETATVAEPQANPELDAPPFDPVAE